MVKSQEELIVSIQCMVYNHEPYLRQCLDGFVMQKTNFKFEAIVHDDVSTDGSAAIIREYAEKYPDIIKPIFEQENQYSKKDGSIDRIMNNASHGKYIALCEGDDYWTDPLKLQKQVDFLNEHPEYVLSHTAFSYQIVYEDNKIVKANDAIKNNIKIHSTYENSIIEHILDYNKYRIQTATAIYRKDILEQIEKDKIKHQQPFFLMGDTPLWVRLCQYGKLHFLEDNTTIYRQHLGSACRENNNIKRLRFVLSCSEMRIYFANLYNISSNCKKKFETAYKKDLLNYMLYDNSYIPMFKPYNTTLEKHLFYNIILNRAILYIIKPFYNRFNLSRIKKFIKTVIKLK